MNKKHLYTTLLALTLTATPACAQTAPTFTLAQLTDSALQNNARMSKARQDIEAAGEQRKEAYTHYFPNVSGTGFWFTTNHGMAKMDINPGEMIDPALGQALAQSFPPEALAALANPTSMTMMKNGVMAGVSAVQPVFAGGQIVNGNKLARLGEVVSQLQLQLTEDEIEKNAAQYFWQIVSLQEKMRTPMVPVKCAAISLFTLRVLAIAPKERSSRVNVNSEVWVVLSVAFILAIEVFIECVALSSALK